MNLQQIAQQIFDAQPFTRLIGAELVSVGEKEAEIRLPISENLKQQHGFVHGGIISYLADNSITFAGGMALQGDSITAEYKINYVRPAIGTHLIARAKVVNVGKKQAVCQAEIYAFNESVEKLCAIALGTVVRSRD
jgi:uncharacterized protein (TIGR00369 family)